MKYEIKELQECQNALFGAWVNTREDLYLLFDDYQEEFGNETILIVKRNNEIEKAPYYLNYVPMNRVALHLKFSIRCMPEQKMMLDLISDDTLELKIGESYETLRKLIEVPPSTFELS